ncbi:hypothetical protein RHSIM_Rhsim08G0160500 [Rhododendron simsii]|uniref:Transposase MuDR plant domain-containing protein n=1 Tax=Rhododendron simsii TaxID=118357 RepID=A0A834GNL0_RHOSS|nr:hypothetical protein RHSIM_Rhsim08G0160500 [Rhododendron simsii]
MVVRSPMPPAYFDLIINHKGKVVRLPNIDPINIAILTWWLMIDLDSDKSLMDMFNIDVVPSTLNLFVEMESPDLCLVEHPSVVDVEDVEVVDATQDGHAYGYNDEDDDWNMDREGEVESNDGGRLMDEIRGVDDEGLSDYQSGDDEGNISSGSDEVTEHAARFDTSYYGKEPYVDCKGEVVLEEKMIFANVDAFRAKLRDYTVEKGFKIVRDKNEKARVTAHCDVEGCPWRIHASPLPNGITYQIKTYTPEHTCTRVNHNEDANSTWIAKKLLKDFKENRQLDLDGMQEKLNGRFGIESSRIQFYRAKRKCMDALKGSHGDQYKLLPTYAVEVRKTNPGSLIKMDYNRPFPTQNPMFRRLFVSFAGMIKGFLNGCRPFIMVDGCHLKGPYGGVLISAVALDGNNGLFPLAVAVVESENNQS